MPASELTSWGEWRLDITDEGCVLLTCGPREIGRVWVEVDDTWTITTSVECDQYEALLARGDGLAGSIRHNVDRTWTLRVALRNPTSQRVSVTAPRICIDTMPPVQVWDGGEQGWIVVDAGDSLLVGELLGGAMSLVGKPEGSLRQINVGAGNLIHLEPVGEQPTTVHCVWRFEPVTDYRALAGRLPEWWPETTAIEHGAEIELRLLDGTICEAEAVHKKFMHLAEREGTFSITRSRPGISQIHVHEGRRVTRMDLAYAEPFECVLSIRADDILRRDPRTCTPVQGLVVGRAMERGLIRQETARIFVSEIADRHQDFVADPFTVSLLTIHAQCTGEMNLLAEAVALAADLPHCPGSGRVWLEAALPANLAGLAVPQPVTRPGRPSSVDEMIAHAEHVVLVSGGSPRIPDELWAAMALTGVGLPLSGLDPLRLAQVISLARIIPEHWRFTDRWPHDLAFAADQASLRLLASEPSDEVLAWLSW